MLQQIHVKIHILVKQFFYTLWHQKKQIESSETDYHYKNDSNYLFLFKGNKIIKYCYDNIDDIFNVKRLEISNKETILDVGIGLYKNTIICQHNMTKKLSYHSIFYDQIGTKWSFKTRILSIHCGMYHQILIDECDNAFGLGDNHFGQLGCGSIQKINKYKPIFSKVKLCECLPKSTIIVSTDNIIFSTGNNYSTVIGQDSQQDIFKQFKRIGYFDNSKLKIVEIKHGYFYTLFKDSDGLIYCWGFINDEFQSFNDKNPCILNDDIHILQYCAGKQQIYLLIELTDSLGFTVLGRNFVNNQNNCTVDIYELYQFTHNHNPIIDMFACGQSLILVQSLF